MSAMATVAPDARTEVFESHRQGLFGIAYRMLGNAAEAEDVVQDAWLRFERAGADVDSPKAFLSTIVSRLCLDRLRSARHRRETYPGTWLPEPIVEPIDAAPAPDVLVGGRELISYATMILLETLAPSERAVFVLSEAFSYSHREIAATIGVSEPSSRQLLHRARQRLHERERRYTTTMAERRRLTEAFLRAASAGDLDSLKDLLAEDIVVTSDGGGKAVAAINPVYGRDRVYRFILGTMGKEPPEGVALALVNGEPGIVTWYRGKVQLVGSFEWRDGRLQEFHIMRNPDKFTHISPLVAGRP
jgi:RNA polymerase sigma-70 factor (ECF subfamily)